MKLLLLVLTLTAVNLAKAKMDEEKFNKLAVECGEELSIRPDEVELVLHQEIRGRHLHGCLVKCIMLKIGIINERGQVQLGNYHDVIPKGDPYENEIAACQHVVVETCEDALTLAKCID